MANFPKVTTLEKLAVPVLVCAMALILVPGPDSLAQQERSVVPVDRSTVQEALSEDQLEEQRAIEREAAAEQAAADQAALETNPHPVTDPTHELPHPSAHATMEAPVELVALAAREPEQFIGKTLVLDDGTNEIIVGPVLDLRQHTRDQELHLVVDATAYFNSPTEYAVAVRDVDRIEGDKVVTPEAAGMHLRGMEYYAEDYNDIPEPVAPAPPSEFD